MKSSLPQRIKPLSVQLANQIAAGEVVERPASVLKELLENSIDAGSDLIEVDITQGGKALIRVKDNGLGINKEDLPLAVSRHATSKLYVIEDLENVSSLGFRGEALASISSISRLSIASKFTQSDKAWSIDTSSDTDFTNYHAEIIPAALSVGTLIEVRDLFYNTPARRKFLRTDKTEFRYIEDVFKRIALSHFDVAFKLTHNKKLIKKLSAVSSTQQRLFRLQKIFGENFIEQLKEVNETSQNFHDLGSLQLSGWISNESYFRSQADQQFFYVNGRYVRDKLLNHALRQAYQETLPAEQYAAYILYLNIDPGAVDVNVHPTKHEVRFRQSRMVHDFIVSALSRTLSPALINSDSSYTEQSQRQEVVDPDIISQSFSVQNYSLQNHSPQNYQSQNYQSQSNDRTTLSVKDQLDGLNKLYNKSIINIPIEINKSDNRLLQHSDKLDSSDFKGQILTLFGSTLLAQENDNLWVVDTFKVMPIINNEILHSQLLSNVSINNKESDKSLDNIVPITLTVRSQKLLIPKNINLSQVDCELLIKWQTYLKLMGLEFTLSGPESLMLRVIPQLPFILDIKPMLRSLVDLLLKIQCSEQEPPFMEQSMLHKIAQKIAFSIDPIQTIDKNKQQLIMNYLSQSQDTDFSGCSVPSDVYKKTFRILNSHEITKIIESA
ncbi:MAG: DNA mismatch repair endonuclease MutL [Pseudomonadota bacterium]